MQDIHARIRLIEQQFQAMVGEFNTTLNEIQVTMQAMAKMTTTALKSLDERLATIEAKFPAPKPADSETGKEL